MKGELVSILTADHVRLDGLYVASTVETANSPFDAAVISHGLGGNFYGAKLLKHVAGFLVDRGISCVLGNNRGHDLVNWSSREAKLATLGAAFETVGECTFDIEGWIDFLIDKGHTRILVAGHSLGAIKSLYAVAHPGKGAESRFVSVAGIAALSATRLNYQCLMNSPGSDKFERMIASATAMNRQGQGGELMRVEFPFPTWMTADAYLEKYGEANRYDWISFARQIELPSLLVFGEKELNENPAFDGLQSEVELLVSRHANYQLRVIEGADHFYSFQYKLVRLAVEEWIDSLK